MGSPINDVGARRRKESKKAILKEAERGPKSFRAPDHCRDMYLISTNKYVTNDSQYERRQSWPFRLFGARMRIKACLKISLNS